MTLRRHTIAGHAFNSATVDGRFGLLAVGTSARFDEVNVKTDDGVFIESEPSEMLASTSLGSGTAASAPTQNQIDSVLAAVMSQWIDVLGSGHERLAALGDIKVTVADLGGATLAYSEGGAITIDSDAAGNGWYVDLSPEGSEEFRIRLDDKVLGAHSRSEAWGGMDLVTVLAHEVGHVLGLDHDEAQGFAVMADQLDAGVRYTFDRSAHGQSQPQVGGADAVTGKASGFIGGEGALMRDEELTLLTTAVTRGTGFDESGFDGTTRDQGANGAMTSGMVDPVYLWLDFDVTDEHRRFSDDEDDTVRADDEQANEVYADWSMPNTNKDAASSESGETGQAGGGGESSQSGDGAAAQLINWDDALDGLGMGFSPFNGTKLGKHGPNLPDYDYLTLIKE